MHAMSMAMVALVLAGCSGKGEETLLVKDANNYEFTGTFAFDTVAVKSATDFCVDWSALTTDIRGRAVTNVDEVALSEFGLSEQEVLDKAQTNDIAQSDALSQWLWPPDGVVAAGETEACTTDFGIIGQPFDPALLAENDHTWLLSLIDTTGGPQNILTSLFVDPTDSESNTDVALADTSASLEYTIDIHSKPKLQTSAGADGWTLDWAGVSTDVFGHPYDNLQGDDLLVAHYDFGTVEEIEDVFLQLDTEATETYELNVFGVTTANLLNAQADDGTAFPGFTTDGIWLVAITCSQCTSPVPLILSVVEVAE